jgi:flagellar biosynthesis protein FliR
MFEFTDSQLAAWLASVVFPFVRIAALIATTPVLGDSEVPRRVKIGLAIFITIIVAPTVGAVPRIDIVSGDGILLIARQLLIGAAMGFTVRLAFSAISYAGDLIGLQMGIGFATLVDPETNDQSPVIGSLLGYFASLAFLVANGPLMMIAGVAESFNALPIVGSDTAMLEDWKMLVMSGSAIFGLAIHMALPVVAALLVTNVALGVMTRAAPQLNLFSIGFPITIAVGLLVLMASLPVVLALSDNTINATVARFLH